MAKIPYPALAIASQEIYRRIVGGTPTCSMHLVDPGEDLLVTTEGGERVQLYLGDGSALAAPDYDFNAVERLATTDTGSRHRAAIFAKPFCDTTELSAERAQDTLLIKQAESDVVQLMCGEVANRFCAFRDWHAVELEGFGAQTIDAHFEADFSKRRMAWLNSEQSPDAYRSLWATAVDHAQANWAAIEELATFVTRRKTLSAEEIAKWHDDFSN